MDDNMEKHTNAYEANRKQQTAEWKAEFKEFCKKQEEVIEAKQGADWTAKLAQVMANHSQPATPTKRKPRMVPPRLRIIPQPRKSLPRVAKRNINCTGSESNSVYSESASSDAEEEYKPAAKRRRMDTTSFTTYTPPPSTSLVTAEMLANTVEKYKNKLYSTAAGTTCHQCRQKTLDTKTICRSGRCVGMRGYFCKLCLRIRYGEDFIESLLDPNWKCPDCRRICNGSICRRRVGLAPTGQLFPHIGNHLSVRHYLREVVGEVDLDYEENKECGVVSDVEEFNDDSDFKGFADGRKLKEKRMEAILTYEVIIKNIISDIQDAWML